MNPLLDTVTDAQATVLGAIDDLHEPTVRGVTTVTATLDRVLPDISVPRTGFLPTVTDAVDNQFTFVIELLKRQRKTAKAVAKASAPVTNRINPGTRAAKAPNKVTKVTGVKVA